MARIAGEPGGVIRGGDLREARRFGDVGFVTAGAKHGSVYLRWLERGGIFRMRGERSMTGLARDPFVLSLYFRFQNVGMTALTSLVAGKGNRSS